ncbi:MAG TPA: hypothetical protein VMD59_00375, partial [Acidimicrobiales bacterium]|nr:hypothetical protein [Acidimicrobiales bacterium]
TRDAFASVEELREATGLVPGRVDLELVEGADHSMRRRDGEVAALVATWIAALGAPRHPRQPRADPDQGVSGPTPTSRVR